jgi:RHS repeat-associated protein
MRYLFLAFLLLFAVQAAFGQTLVTDKERICPNEQVTYVLKGADGCSINVASLKINPPKAGRIVEADQNKIVVAWGLNYGVIEEAVIIGTGLCNLYKNGIPQLPENGGKFLLSGRAKLEPRPYTDTYYSSNTRISGTEEVALDAQARFLFTVIPKQVRTSPPAGKNNYTYRWFLNGQAFRETSIPGLAFYGEELGPGTYTLSCIPYNLCNVENADLSIPVKTFKVTCSSVQPISGIEGPRYLCENEAFEYTIKGALDADNFQWETPPGVTVSRIGTSNSFNIMAGSSGNVLIRVRPVKSGGGSTDEQCLYGDYFELPLTIDAGTAKRSSLTLADQANSQNDIHAFSSTVLPALTVNTCAERTDRCGYSLKKLDVQARFHAGDEHHSWGQHDFQANVVLQLTFHYTNSTSTIKTVTLIIDQNSPEQFWRYAVPAEQLALLRAIEVLPLSSTLPAASELALLKQAIRLELSLQEQNEFNVTAVSITPNTLNPVAGQWEQTLNWSSSCPNVAGYQLQMLKHYTNSNPIEHNDPRWKQALTLETESPTTSLKLTIGEGSGYYSWRIRAIGNKEGGIANPLNWGSWSEEISVFQFTDPYAGKNWVYGRVFSEENKQKEQLVFANGLQQVTQQLTRINTDGDVFAVQSLQDYLGRNAVTSLPVPLGSRLKYTLGGILEKADGGKLGVEDIDGKATWKSPATAYDPAGYYGNAGTTQTNHNDLVPVAEGYPYQRTLFTADQSGRVREQGGVGNTHSLGKGRTVKTYYTDVSDAELRSLFGIQTPEYNDVYKVVTLDPNGTASVQYIDKAGKVIATALTRAGAADLPLKDLPNRREVLDIVEEVPVSGEWGTYGNTSQKEIVLTEAKSLNVQYTLSPGMMGDACTNICQQCDYEVEVLVRDLEAEDAQFIERRTLIVNGNELCNGGTANRSLNFDTPVLPAGRYLVQKNIRSYTQNTDGLFYIDVKLQELYHADFTVLKTYLQGEAGKDVFFEQEDLAQFYTKLASMPGVELIEVPVESDFETLTTAYFKISLPLQEKIDENGNATCEEVQIMIPDKRSQCAPEPVNCATPNFEEYFEEVWAERHPEYLPVAGSNALPYLPGYNKGELNAMIVNMVNDEFHAYDCSMLWNVWKGLADSYELMLSSNEPSEDFEFENNEGFTFNLLDAFFTHVGATDHKYQFRPNVVDRLYAYRQFVYNYQNTDPGRAAQRNYMVEICGTRDCPNFAGLSPDKRKNIYQYITSVENFFTSWAGQLPVDSRAAVQEMEIKLEEQCHQVCEDRREAFRDAVVQKYYEQGMYIQGDLYQVKLSTDEFFTNRWVSTNLPLTPEQKTAAVDTCQINGIVEGLIKNCRGYCDLSLIEPPDPSIEPFRLGTDEEISRIQRVYFNSFEIQLSAGGSCPAGYDVVQSEASGFVSECLTDLTGYINGLIQVTNSLGKPFSARISTDRIACPINLGNDSGIGELSTNVFSYVGPLDKDCNHTNMDDCHDPLRYNYWLSVSDDRRLSNGNPRDLYNFRLIWSVSPSSYAYYGSCYPNPNGYDNAEGGIPMLIKPVNDVVGDNGIRGCSENHVYLIKFFTYQADGSKVYIKKNDIHSISEPYLVSPGTVIPGTVPSRYYNERDFAFTKVNITLKGDEPGTDVIFPAERKVISAFIESNYNNTAYFRPKNFSEPTCASVNVCFKWNDAPDTVAVAPGFPVNEYNIPTCEEASLYELKNDIIFQVESILAARQKAFQDKYLQTCADPAKIDDRLTIGYQLGDYHHTLYYYDRAGNLMRTVPPAGVNYADADNHKLVTDYEYNSLGQLVRQNTPDGKTTEFYYNNLGQLRFSQNAQQKLDGTYSYTKYDALGRVKEVGLSSESIATFSAHMNKSGFPEGGSERTFTTYTEPADIRFSDGSPQRYLQNRVSYSHTENGIEIWDDVYTYYSYDPHGNVEWLIQKLPGMSENFIRYQYDLISGKVTEVAYNEHRNDRFYHRYAYDANNRLLAVQTSADRVVWEEDARYEYYRHGPLKRTVLGEDKVQGIDYVYTLQGWLKAVNHPSLLAQHDPGADGQVNTVAEDAFGMMLGYYTGDYKSKIGTTGFESVETGNSWQLQAETGRDLYNGNISSWSSRIQAPAAATGLKYPDKLTGNTYVYDELNRLVASNFLVHSGSWGAAPDKEFSSSYRYDASGNIGGKSADGLNEVGLTRYAHGANPLLDALTYEYYEGTNRLKSVTDAVAANRDMDFHGQSTYEYDAVGNLVKEVNVAPGQPNDITEVKWTVYGKVKEVITSGEHSRNMQFLYDAAGNRVRKTVREGASITHTYYVRDASGNVMAVYEYRQDATTNAYQLMLTEQPLYGSDRLGQRTAAIVVPHDAALLAETGPKQPGPIKPKPEPGGRSSTKEWAVPVVSSEGSSIALIDMQQTPQLLQVSAPISSGRLGSTLLAEDSEGNTSFTLAVNEEGGAVPLDKQGELMATGLGAGGAAASTPEAAFGAPVLSMPLPGPTDQQWVFTFDAEGRALRHTLNPAAVVGGAGLLKGEFSQTNVAIGAADARFMPAMALLRQGHSGSGKLFLLRKHIKGLQLEAYSQTLASETGPSRLGTIEGPTEQAKLALSQDGSKLGVLLTRGEQTDWFGEGSGTELRVYELGEGYTAAELLYTHHLQGGRRYSSLAFGKGGDKVYLSSSEPQNGYSLEQLSLSSGTLSPLAQTIGYSELGTAPSGDIYASLAGSSHLVRISETGTGSTISYETLNLPQGYSLSGSLPSQGVLVGAIANGYYSRNLGEKNYELKDHLGNIRALIDDIKLSTLTNGVPGNYEAGIIQTSNYYPFGMLQPDRHANATYRYGFNGKEKDPEGMGGGGSTYDYGFRIYNPQIAKFLSVDPLTKSYPMLTPYQFASNRPIEGIDLDGLEFFRTTDIIGNTASLNLVIAVDEDIMNAYGLLPLEVELRAQYQKLIKGSISGAVGDVSITTIENADWNTPQHKPTKSKGGGSVAGGLWGLTLNVMPITDKHGNLLPIEDVVNTILHESIHTYIPRHPFEQAYGVDDQLYHTGKDSKDPVFESIPGVTNPKMRENIMMYNYMILDGVELSDYWEKNGQPLHLTQGQLEKIYKEITKMQQQGEGTYKRNREQEEYNDWLNRKDAPKKSN